MASLNIGNGSSKGISRFETQTSGRMYLVSQRKFLELKRKLNGLLEELITYREKYGKLKGLKAGKEVPDKMEMIEETIERLRQ